MRPTQFLLAALFSLLSVVALTSAAPTTSGSAYVRADGEVTLSRSSPALSEKAETELRHLSELHSLAKRADIQVRNPAIMFIVRQAVTSIIRGIIDQVNEDKLARAEFTQNFVSAARAQYPQFNWLIIHTEHSTLFDGIEGEDWGHSHEEFDIVIGGTIGYEVYWFGSGTVLKPGDGGYLNWAYSGFVTHRSEEHDIVTFAAPPPAA